MKFVLKNNSGEIIKTTHLFIANKDGISFFITNGLSYYIVYNDKLKKSLTEASAFYIRDGILRYHDLYVCWRIIDGNEKYFVSNDLCYNVLYAEYEFFDIPYKYKGSYAFVYSPGLKLGPKHVTRISTDIDNYYEIPEQYREKLSTFCLFPVYKEILDNVVIEEMKECVNSITFQNSYMNENSFLQFLIAFRGLFLGLKQFKDEQFFHGDISPNNIVIDDGVFKFIDFDLSLFLTNIKDNNSFHEGLIHPIYPFALNIIMIKYIQQKRGLKINWTVESDKSHKEYIKYHRESFRFGGFAELLNRNICYDEEWERIYERYNDATDEMHHQIFYYTSLYQLVLSMLFYTNLYSKVSNLNKVKFDLMSFFDKCLNFRRFGFTSVEDVIPDYDAIIEKLSSETNAMVK